MVRAAIVLGCVLALVAGCNAVAGIEPATLDDTSGDVSLDLPPDPPGVAPSSTCAQCDVPHATATCTAGKCAVGQCAPGFADCNGNAADGCEADLSTAQHCGSCNTACSASEGVCVRGGTCASICPSSQPTQCGSTCTDVRSDPSRCGSCGNVCPTPTNGTATCSGGRCAAACSKGYHSCGGVCVSSTSPATCGPSCSPCAAPANAVATCDGVGCGFTCAAGFADAGGACR